MKEEQNLTAVQLEMIAKAAFWITEGDLLAKQAIDTEDENIRNKKITQAREAYSHAKVLEDSAHQAKANQN